MSKISFTTNKLKFRGHLIKLDFFFVLFFFALFFPCSMMLGVIEATVNIVNDSFGNISWQILQNH